MEEAFVKKKKEKKRLKTQILICIKENDLIYMQFTCKTVLESVSKIMSYFCYWKVFGNKKSYLACDIIN